MVQGILTILIGIWFTLVGFGKVKVSKNPGYQAGFIMKWGKFFRIAGPLIAVGGVAMLLMR
jgi:hypothetical protein